ncbi:MAG: RHS repeat-associated core domain-containing protein, partial [Kiritimatiellae bacterium]|nr:RHS repeat-associated core domain-containing protein [Kiritimatiellia bacterium]
IAAVVPASSPDGWDEMSAVTGRVFVAQTPERFTYDADGNMTCDGRFRYTWNAENRLVRAQELVAPTNRHPYTVSYAYDHRGRMVSKRITENDGHDTLVKSIAYVWDGWNVIRETVTNPSTLQPFNSSTDYVWGLDLDGTLQGAGGVGGLLAVVRGDGVFLPTYDANGNISEYVTTNGEIVAHYDYSPFGETLIESGDLASTFTHRFSTKPWCSVTRLYEYQMRKYRPAIGRWLSRDPIGERTGLNAFIFANNNISLYDIAGLQEGGAGSDITIGGTLTEMLLAGILKVDEIHIAKNSKVYEKMIGEIKKRVHGEILKTLKSESCCKKETDINGTLEGVYPYGGELFTMSLAVSIVTQSTIPIELDPNFGPKNYSFYTIGHNGSPLRYFGKAYKRPTIWRLLCCYSYEVEVKGLIKERFDFVPDRPWDGIGSVAYNIAATLWRSIYNDFLGASRPKVQLPIHETITGLGCY